MQTESIDLIRNRNLIKGAFSIEKTENGFFLQRMSPVLVNLYRDMGEHMFTRAICTSGIRIAFKTNSGYFGIRLNYGRESRPVRTADIFIDSADPVFIAPEEEGGSAAFQTALSEGNHEITVYLPVMAEGWVESMEIEKGASLEPVEPRKRSFMFLGDSITQGMTVSQASMTYPVQISNALEADFTNLAVGGEIMRGELGKHALAYEWDYAFVAYGVNDFARMIPLETVARETHVLLTHLASRKKKLFLLTPISKAGGETNEAGATLDDYRKTIADVGAGFTNVTVIDGKKLLCPAEENFVDGVHPNDSGMNQYARNLLRLLQPVI